VIAFLLRELSQLRQKKWFVQWLSSILPKPKALQAPKIRQMKPDIDFNNRLVAQYQEL
jgi:hypothetical protein